MREKVVKVSIDAEVGGFKLAVQEATLTNAVNSIPTIELSCAPSEPNYSYDNLMPNVIKPHISEFAEMYMDLGTKAEGMETPGSVEIKLEGDESDSIILNWILVGVGLSSVSATGAPYMTVILQHPICKLTKVGSIYETPKSDVSTALNAALAGSQNLLDIINATYWCLRENVEYWPTPPGYQHATEFRDMLGVGDFSPDQYLEWKGADRLFLAGNGDGGADDRFAQAIGRMVMQTVGGSSTWDTILAASGELLISVTQDESCNYTQDKLVLEPTRPWKSASVTIDESRVALTELPGIDPLRISGVMATMLGPYAESPDTGFLDVGNDRTEDPVEEVMYAPDVGVTAANGRIIKTQAPRVLDAAFRRDAPYGGSIPEGYDDMQKFREDGYASAIGKYCKALYEITAASMVRAKAQLALSLHIDGKLLVPGNTCKFVSEGKTIYHGYMQQVVHHLSTGGGNSTYVMMSYVRPEESFKVNGQTAVQANAPNAAYE